MDLVYLGTAGLFFAASWLLVRLCASLCGEGGPPMTWLYLTGGAIAAALLIYLMVALLKPEKFS